MAAPLPPAHPLVVGLGVGLGDASITAAVKRKTVPQPVPPPPEIKADDAASFGVTTGAAQVVLLSGYAGGRVPGPPPSTDWWRVLFTDASLSAWVLICEDDIKLAQRVEDPSAAIGLRDYLWVASEAPLGRGSASRAPSSIFLTGAFTR